MVILTKKHYLFRNSKEGFEEMAMVQMFRVKMTILKHLHRL